MECAVFGSETAGQVTPANDLTRLIAAEERLAGVLRAADLRATSMIDEARREAEAIEAGAMEESTVAVARLAVDLAAERDSALHRLAAEAEARDWMLGPDAIDALAECLVRELLESGQGPP